MMVSKIRYKGHSWLHNPAKLRVEKEQILTENNIPYGKTQFQNLGEKSRVVTGVGQFYGEDCLLQYNNLLKLKNQQGSGILSLPDMKPFYAFFKSVELACEPTPEVVTYHFVFVEDLSADIKDDSCFYHTVSHGENLWDIAYRYSVNIDVLVKLNRWIKRIDELMVGEKVRIC